MYLFKIARRYFLSKQNKQRQTNIMIIIGIALGFTALVIVMGLMNSLQDSQLSSLKALQSFDLIYEDKTADINQIKALKGVESAFYFYESPAIAVNTETSDSTFLTIRAFEDDQELNNPRMINFIKWGYYAKPEKIEGLAFGLEAANKINSTINNKVKLTILKEGKTATLMPYNFTSTVNSLFYTNISELNSSTVYCNYNQIKDYLGEGERKIGIFLINDSYLKSIEKSLPQAITWKEYNASLYQALQFEKFIVFLFLSFILIIVCVNLKNSTKRMIINKENESAILCTFGMDKKRIGKIYLIQATAITIIALLFGTILSLLIANNLNVIFRFINWIIRAFSEQDSIFAYLPIKIILKKGEIALFSLFIIFANGIFTWIGMRTFKKSEIMEVIKHENN